MAGDACFPTVRPLTQAGLDQMREAGLDVEVLLDLSHNEHISIECDGREQLPKKIHLDLSVKAAHGQSPERVLTRLKNAPTRSDTFAMRTAIIKYGYEARFRQGQRVSVEVPTFDLSVVKLTETFVPDDLKAAVAACRARTREAFNALPVATRNAMGMYRPKASNQGFEPTSPGKARTA